MTPRQYLDLSYHLGYRQRWTLLLAGLSFAATLTEAAGLVLLLPIFEFIQAKGDIAGLAHGSKLWSTMVGAADYIGVTVALPLLMVASISLILFRQVFTFFKAIATQMVAETIMRRMRIKGARAYLNSSANYQDQVKLGEIVNTLTTEASAAGAALTAPARIVGIVVVGVIYVGTLGALSPSLTAVVLALGGVLGFALIKVMHAMQRAGRNRLAATDQWFRMLIRRLQNARLIKIAGTEDAEADTMNSQAALLERRSVAIVRLRTWGDVMVEPIVAAFALALLYFATQNYGMSIGEVGLFLVVLLRLSPMARSAASEFQLLAANLPSLEAVGARIRQMENAAEVDTGGEVFAGFEREIRFEDVWFRYPSREEFALKGVDLTIKRGQKIAIVGPSGAGKSTLIDLLFQIHETQAGRILVDGKPITAFSRRTVREHIAYIPQAAQVLADTIGGHVAYGNGELGKQDIATALRLAGAEDFVAQLADGPDTVLQEIRSGLSGGQLQRIELARALARRARLLVLDEPTSSLDAHSESAFRAAITDLVRSGDHTVVMVAHRLALASDADCIVVMQGGTIRERGRHDELMARRGWYFEAWGHQQLESGPFADGDRGEWRAAAQASD
jgi:subfamily B ATP-binding cassette protein MsbA